MRIVAGAWRGRTLIAPPGHGTRPTADRVRQALFDMLMHAEWGGRVAIEGASVLDVFAGTGALGLEALSRGASSACFIESDAAALKALRANVAACRAEDRATVVAGDALSVRPRVVAPGSWPGDRAREGALVTTYGVGGGRVAGGRSKPGDDTKRASLGDTKGAAHCGTQGASLVFLDPPYEQDLVPRAIAHLRQNGAIAPEALIVAETGCDEIWLPEQPLLAERHYGAARILVFRGA